MLSAIRARICLPARFRDAKRGILRAGTCRGRVNDIREAGRARLMAGCGQTHSASKCNREIHAIPRPRGGTNCARWRSADAADEAILPATAPDDRDFVAIPSRGSVAGGLGREAHYSGSVGRRGRAKWNLFPKFRVSRKHLDACICIYIDAARSPAAVQQR